ncbi:MAG: LysR family transcriptional regulator [Mesorhizobium sp.]|uniref:LysR family transcriptional regulator n=1 Tax=unclassified Mesorhizobium TaxID=325217 RepID=UPI000F75413E|nr:MULTISPECIES: LysR family transcriptional regulator [unclassified Mesorhizobium]RVC69226.1 LysR family transcriptional regulator [Mesorhizobium sp. M00.F.Ca.ET.038.03.1.1]RVC80971.1 LysR family transcriptional regulator [Mesorhizobium sp. M2A.F.Ca.ET.046.02.1.1]AZO39507.1 LysR family transcriptional regulator [Mesorhizobium sp. M2A.F.Ca.ET.046.03.2.1]RWB45180.1 MAG: LysR family transcriptional regulator [Mesorhizobium sp.]RWE10910.1 MAG: LysR family transcriptional regulator [Mesorhizobium 
MKLDGIASFVAVAEEGSISGAARTLRLSKSVVSERLAELECSLGATLLHRTTRKVSVTEDGTAFFERAKRILREVSEAATDLAERRGTLSGPMRISAPVTFGRMHLGPALYPFLAANPDIEMSLELDDRRVDIASGIYDGVVRHGAIDDSRLMVWRLAPSRRVLVASGDYLASLGTPATIEQLDAHKGIFYTNRGVADWRFATSTGIEMVRARVGLRVNNGDMMRDAAIAGLGVALLPLFICGSDIRNGKLKVIDVGVQPAPEFIYLAHPEGRRPSAKLRALAEHLKAAFGEPPYWEDLVI